MFVALKSLTWNRLANWKRQTPVRFGLAERFRKFVILDSQIFTLHNIRNTVSVWECSDAESVFLFNFGDRIAGHE